MNKHHCSETDCDLRTGCQRGELYPKDCQYYESSEDATTSKADYDSPIPWHGSVLGLADLQHVAARGRPHLIGLVGTHNSGKTTFLTSVYLKLFQGARIPDKRFSGSFSLSAWESLANNLRYPNETPAMFPRHTPNTEDRVPGLLHLAFRNSRNRLEDYLFTDAPGEWFSNWSTNRSAENAKGARWIAKFSDSILFFIDCEELAGENVGTTRNSITQLAQRLADEVEDKRVLIIWSKHDIQLDPIIHEQISTRLADYLPAAKHFNISVYEDDHLGIQTVAKELLGRLDFQGTRITIKVPIRADNPFFTFRSV